jgi:hypothetical protein
MFARTHRLGFLPVEELLSFSNNEKREWKLLRIITSPLDPSSLAFTTAALRVRTRTVSVLERVTLRFPLLEIGVEAT